LIPKKTGDRIKTNRRDAVTLARLFRAGELTSVWVPDSVHEAVRDLVRARESAAGDVRSPSARLRSRPELLVLAGHLLEDPLYRHRRAFNLPKIQDLTIAPAVGNSHRSIDPNENFAILSHGPPLVR
jgi:transposase